jgi:hypothetical protein
MPAYGGGLSAQWGFKAETTVGTQVVVDKFLEFLSESLSWEATWQRSAGLRAGQGYTLRDRMQQTAESVSGDVTFEYPDRGAGLLWKHALGSTISAPTLIATTAYKQIHTPGAKTGMGLTMQFGRPQTDAVVKPHTFRGVKIPSWEWSVSDGEIAQMQLTCDGWSEDLAAGLAVASFPANTTSITFKHSTAFKLGGTATTAAGETTVASGVQATTVFKGFTIRGETPMATERRGLGNSGIKREQIENDRPTITGTLEGEYTSQSEIYALVKSGAATAMQADFSYGDAGSSNPYLISFIAPSVKFSSGSVNADGPDILGQSVNFEALHDGTTNPVLQVKIVNQETVL